MSVLVGAPAARGDISVSVTKPVLVGQPMTITATGQIVDLMGEVVVGYVDLSVGGCSQLESRGTIVLDQPVRAGPFSVSATVAGPPGGFYVLCGREPTSDDFTMFSSLLPVRVATSREAKALLAAVRRHIHPSPARSAVIVRNAHVTTDGLWAGVTIVGRGRQKNLVQGGVAVFRHTAHGWALRVIGGEGAPVCGAPLAVLEALGVDDELFGDRTNAEAYYPDECG